MVRLVGQSVRLTRPLELLLNQRRTVHVQLYTFSLN